MALGTGPAGEHIWSVLEPEGTRPSYLPNSIEIYCERNLFPHFTRLMDDFTFRADDYGSSIAKLTCIVYIHEIALVLREPSKVSAEDRLRDVFLYPLILGSTFETNLEPGCDVSQPRLEYL